MHKLSFETNFKYFFLIILILFFYLCNVYFLLDSSFQIHFLNIGQGDSILIELPHFRYILIDAGEGNQVIDELSSVVPFWVRNIDIVICTHADSDHMDGARFVLQKYNVSKIYVNNDSVKDSDLQLLKETAKSGDIPLNTLIRGDNIVYGDVQIDVLWPEGKFEKEFNQNIHSLVLHLKYQNFSFLFTGDIEKGQEELISNYLYKKIDVFKVAHHGSNTSTSPKAIATLSPKVAVISVGKDNKFNHPSSEVISTLMKNKIFVLRTDQDGTITIRAHNDRLIILRQ